MNQFNLIFCVLWRKIKAQWVVTSELEGPGGKKQGKGLVSMFCAALIIASMMGLKAEEAFDLTGVSISNGDVVQVLDVRHAVLINSGTGTRVINQQGGR